MSKRRGGKKKRLSPRQGFISQGELLDAAASRSHLPLKGVKCFVCSKPILSKTSKPWIRIPGDTKHPETRYRHDKCAPGSWNWLKTFPGDEIAQSLYFNGSEERMNKLVEFAQSIGKTTGNLSGKDMMKYINYLGQRGGEEEMAKKIVKGKEVVEKKGKRGSGLIPREAVEVPTSLLSHEKIGKDLKALLSARKAKDDVKAREARIALRKEGFKLSDPTSWKKFQK